MPEEGKGVAAAGSGSLTRLRELAWKEEGVGSSRVGKEEGRGRGGLCLCGVRWIVRSSRGWAAQCVAVKVERAPRPAHLLFADARAQFQQVTNRSPIILVYSLPNGSTC